jgi:hypothetical protein
VPRQPVDRLTGRIGQRDRDQHILAHHLGGEVRRRQVHVDAWVRVAEHEVAVALQQRLHAVGELVGVEAGVEDVAAHLGAAQPGRKKVSDRLCVAAKADGAGRGLVHQAGLVPALIEAPQHVLGDRPEALARRSQRIGCVVRSNSVRRSTPPGS